MRLSRLFEVTFVGALMFTPAIAQEIEQVHEKALQVLREQQANGTPPAQSVPPPAVANPGVDSRDAAFEKFKADNARARAERDARLKAGVAEATKIREQRQAEKRQELQEFLKQRDELRQRQREYDENAVRQAGAVKTQDNPADVHAKALEVLRGEQPPSSAPQDAVRPAAATAPDVSEAEINARAQQILRERNATSATSAAPASPVVTEAELAPRVVAQPQGSIEDTHSKALEVLRQQSGGAQPAPAAAQNPAPRGPQPTPETRERVRQILEGGNATPPQAQSRPAASRPADEAYSKELQERALQILRENAPAASTPAPAAATEAPRSAAAATAPSQPSSAPAATPAAGDVHAKALEVLRQQQSPAAQSALPAPPSQPSGAALDNQTREIIQRQDTQITTREMPPRNNPPIRPIAPRREVLSTDAEEKAREVLRQQAGSGMPSSAAPQSSAASGAAVTPSGDQVQYSRELEERARQILLERGGSQQSRTANSPTGPAATQPAVQPAATAEIAPADVHAQALEALRNVRGEAPQAAEIPAAPKTKRQKIQELTDLYMADKLTPAEYHTRRAKIIAEP